MTAKFGYQPPRRSDGAQGAPDFAFLIICQARSFGHGTLIRIGPGHQVEVQPGRGRVAIRIRQSLSEPVVARNPNSDSAHKKTDGADPTNKPILALLVVIHRQVDRGRRGES